MCVAARGRLVEEGGRGGGGGGDQGGTARVPRGAHGLHVTPCLTPRPQEKQGGWWGSVHKAQTARKGSRRVPSARYLDAARPPPLSLPPCDDVHTPPPSPLASIPGVGETSGGSSRHPPGDWAAAPCVRSRKPRWGSDDAPVGGGSSRGGHNRKMHPSPCQASWRPSSPAPHRAPILSPSLRLHTTPPPTCTPPPPPCPVTRGTSLTATCRPSRHGAWHSSHLDAPPTIHAKPPRRERKTSAPPATSPVQSRGHADTDKRVAYCTVHRSAPGASEWRGVGTPPPPVHWGEVYRHAPRNERGGVACTAQTGEGG